MKVYLFLYPIKEYIYSLLLMWPTFSFNEHQASEINRLIRARYRERGYQIWWLLFSDPNDLEKPDLTRIFDGMNILEGDTLIPCGITFQDHISKKLYADSERVVDRLPKDIEELVLGGFHQGDCVDKVAACAYSRGTPTFVDEDTTEYFFSRTGSMGDIPTLREEFRVSELTSERDKTWINWILERRRNKPWLTQKP